MKTLKAKQKAKQCGCCSWMHIGRYYTELVVREGRRNASYSEGSAGRRVSMDWFFFQPTDIGRYLEAAGFAIVEVIEREPYPPEVEYQSRRAYIFARKRPPQGSARPSRNA